VSIPAPGAGFWPYVGDLQDVTRPLGAQRRQRGTQHVESAEDGALKDRHCLDIADLFDWCR
jgi:hypothetical protein